MRPKFFSSKVSVRALCVFAAIYVVGMVLIGLRTSGPRGNVASPVVGDSVAVVPMPNTADTTCLFRFDPNTIDSSAMTMLGLSPRVAHSVMQYRRHKGVFRQPSDFARIYMLDSADYARLAPYIIIGEEYRRVAHRQPREFYVAPSRYVQRGDTANYRREHRDGIQKFDHQVQLDPNTVDSLTLLRIPGVGPSVAHGILRYRQLLGGYVDIQQLGEVYNVPQDIARWFSQPSAIPAPSLRVNQMEFRQLLRHPYLNLDQVKAITRHRERFGPLSHLEQLSNYDCFPPDCLERLRPYVSFE